VAGDVFLLCSDGVTGALDDDRLEQILLERGLDPTQRVRAVLDAALGEGARDNVGAVIVECRDVDIAPKRRPSARPPSVRPPPESMVKLGPPRPPIGSAPEIIIVGVETHVVPTNSASANLLDALGRFARLRQPSVPEIAQPKPTRCADCGQPLEKGASFCPMCGTSVSKDEP